MADEYDKQIAMLDRELERNAILVQRIRNIQADYDDKIRHLSAAITESSLKGRREEVRFFEAVFEFEGSFRKFFGVENQKYGIDDLASDLSPTPFVASRWQVVEFAKAMQKLLDAFGIDE